MARISDEAIGGWIESAASVNGTTSIESLKSFVEPNISICRFKEEEAKPWAQKGAGLNRWIGAGHDQEVTDGKIINPIPALRKDPVVTAEKALTVEAAWHDAEPPLAGIKTAAGMETASSDATFFENKNPRC